MTLTPEPATKAKSKPLVVDPAAVEYQPDAVALELRKLPFPVHSVLYLSLFAVAAFIFWACVSHTDRVVVSQGKLVPVAPLVVIQPLESVVLNSLEVKAGDHINAGDIVARLDPTFTAADLADVQARLDSVNVEIDRINAELKDAPFLPPDSVQAQVQQAIYADREAQFQSRDTVLAETISQYSADLAVNRQSQTSTQDQITLREQINQISQSLYDKQVGSRLDMLNGQYGTLELKGNLAELVGKQTQLEHQLSGAEAEREAFQRDWRGKLSEDLIAAMRERAILDEEAKKATRRDALSVLRSPISGTVLEVANRSIGSVLQVAEPVASIVPADTALEVEVEVDAADVGSVKVGDNVRLKLEAFPFQKHGTLDGKLRSISPDAFQRGPEKGGGAYFKARVTVPDTRLRDIPDWIKLSPGMNATAEIRVGDRTIISYLLYPIIRVLDESGHEP